MGSRPRIRWPNLARVALGAIACAVLLVGLPSLIRRPEPPPLEPDVGLAPAAWAPTGIVSASRQHPEPRQQQHRERLSRGRAQHRRAKQPAAGERRPDESPLARAEATRAQAPPALPGYAASPPAASPPPADTTPPAPASPPPPKPAPAPPREPDPTRTPGNPPEFGFEH
jgi:hypothetical protein